MALALRLRRALAAASTSASLLRPTASAAASPHRPPLLAPFVAPLPLPRLFLPGGAAGFRSTAAAAARGNYGGGADDAKIDPDEILFEGCDYNHWLITMEFPNPKPSREEMIETYLQTLAKVVGSYEEAKKRMYALSTTTYVGFQAVMTEEMSEKFRETKEYGGDKYENGVITPRPPPVQYSKLSRNDRNRNYRGNYENSPPPQGNYQNSPPPHGNYQNRSPPQGNFQGSRPQQEVRGYAPQQNYTQAGQDGRGYGRNDSADRPGYNAPGGYQGRVNEAGQGFQDPQERRSFSQGQEGDLRPGGPSAPGNYGQPPAPGNYGQPPAPGNYGQPSAPGSYGKPFGPPAYGQPSGSRYAGGNQGGPGYGGDNRQGAAPAYGGDNLQGVSDQYPSPGEGQQGN
ncbi:unnamed protein product [Triticum turgidum subsp. durum]|uniref:MORF/ORRM1/DAG-like MORF domain-containing protein n=1 Tax=Triticum turgidum subsp. durum TaxID=4567 RepID=A0A9R0SI08_TRITD|nr:unnamed protein product [Triticum turgidum subsp. durum]